LSEAHSHRLVVALQTFPPRATVQLLVQEPPSVHTFVHGPSHRPRRTSHVVVNLAHTLTVSLVACFLIERVLGLPKQLGVPIFELSKAQRPKPPMSTQ
jgi:hypothetical protein